MKLVSREEQADQEHVRFSSDAAFSDETEGRARSCEPDLYRTEYQRDLGINVGHLHLFTQRFAHQEIVDAPPCVIGAGMETVALPPKFARSTWRSSRKRAASACLLLP